VATLEINGAGNGNVHVVVDRPPGVTSVAVVLDGGPGHRHFSDEVPI
jgi:hypothetical protein